MSIVETFNLSLKNAIILSCLAAKYNGAAGGNWACKC